jgi:2-iminobutanoate/2-iminopropanoate deaminase
MQKKIVKLEGAAPPVGPFSAAVVANGLVFVSGQIAMDPATEQFTGGGIEGQTEQVLKNLAQVLAAAGSSLDRVVRAGVFLKNMSDFAAMNAVYARHFPVDPPARTTVEVARLPKDVLVEIDAIALA